MDAKDLLTPDNLELLSQLDSSKDYQNYFKWFIAITQIHRPTYHCEEIFKKICEWLTVLKTPFEKDEKNFNIVVRLPSNNFPENAPTSCIQTHIDMVWVGEQINNKIKVEYIKNFKSKNDEILNILQAPKSTLGADDGFGVALCLDIIENKNSFDHGPLEIIFTSDEEQGLISAKKLPKKNEKNENNEINSFNFKYLINCDCLRGDKVYVGCPGCELLKGYLYPEIEKINLENKKIVSLDFSNFTGGHSGATIQNGQANPIKWISYILNSLKLNEINFWIFDMKGGQTANAIPTYCNISFIIDEKNEKKAKELIDKDINELSLDFAQIEKNKICKVEINSLNEEKYAITYENSKQIINILNIIRQGIVRMHPIFKDKVDSSNNLGIVSMKIDSEKKTCEFYIECCSRGSTNTEFDKIENSIRAIFELCNIKNKFETYIASRPWPVKEKSELAEVIKEVAKKEYNLILESGISQVTIECPIFLQLGYTDADIVAVCPNIPLAHCVGEYIDVNEAIKFKNIIIKTLGKLTK